MTTGTPDAPQGPAAMSTEPAAVDRPPHPVGQMTTFELRDYRRQLESAIAFFGGQAPVPPARARLGRALDEVLAEQAERVRSAADA
jgi:hypothetical protein